MDRPHRVGEPVGAMRALTAGATAAGVVALSLVVAFAGRTVAPGPDLRPRISRAASYSGRRYRPISSRPQCKPGAAARSGAAGRHRDGGAASGRLRHAGARGAARSAGAARPGAAAASGASRTIGTAPFSIAPSLSARPSSKRWAIRIAIAGTESIDPAADLQVRRRRMAVRRQRAHGGPPVAAGAGRCPASFRPRPTGSSSSPAAGSASRMSGPGWCRTAGRAPSPAVPTRRPRNRRAKAKMGIFGPPPTATN